MKSKYSDSFPNPTVIEAICEFHFSSKAVPKNSWEGKWCGRLHSQLGDDYEMEPQTAKGLSVQTSSSGESTFVEDVIPLNKMLYKHKKKSQLVQLSPWLLAVNEIGLYPGWHTFLEHIKHSWNALSSTIDAIQITRIGMRYINRIPKKSPTETLGEWINNNDILPKRILTQDKDFFLRCEFPVREDVKLIITLTEEQINSAIKPIIYDIDIVMNKIHENKWEVLSESLNFLHNLIREEFDASQTEKLKSFLNQTQEKK